MPYQNDLVAAQAHIKVLKTDIEVLKKKNGELKRKMETMTPKKTKKPIPNLGWIIMVWICGLFFVGAALAGGLCFPGLNSPAILWRVLLASGGVSIIGTLLTAGLLGKLD